MGVPLSAVMAFWLASPVMDPSMFLLTSGVLGVEFAVAKTLAAIGIGVLGGGGIAPVFTAAFVGVPAYLNGYAALPLVGGLMGQGMAPGAGLAFLVAGGVTSIPAAVAVFALVKRPVFLLYLVLALGGAIGSGLLYQLWVG
nr:hypothetical protein [Sneathiella chinensis]